MGERLLADFPALLASMQARSAALYEAASVRRDLRYGAQPAQRFDWLRRREDSDPSCFGVLRALVSQNLLLT